MAWPLLLNRSVIDLGRPVEVTEDPVEMAVVAVLDARDMIPALSTVFLQAKSKFGPSIECKSRLKALTLLYNRLKINLPRLVQELEIEEDFSEQKLRLFHMNIFSALHEGMEVSVSLDSERSYRF